MIQKRLIMPLLLLLSLAWLAACTGETFSDPTPIPPPPTSSDGVDTAVTNPTPPPTNVPNETTVDPTPTLAPTVTVTITPTAAATAVTNPPVQVISTRPLPATSRDLLFIADGAFKQWNHATGQIETIVSGPGSAAVAPDDPYAPTIGSVTGYAMNADGKRAVVARVIGSATNADIENALTEFSYELLFVDMISRQTWTLVPQVDNLVQFDLSPDAQQLAFVASGLDGVPDMTSNEPAPNNLYVLATGGGSPSNLRQVYQCQPYCIRPEWHIENNLVAFGDNVALWLYNVAANAPEKLLENQGYTSGMTDVGQISVYSPIDWASNGRYLLLWHGRWEGGSRAVLDVPTGSLIPVPDSFLYADVFPTELGWLPDDRLLVWRTDMDSPQITPKVELWRLDLGAGALVLEETAVLNNRSTGVVGGTYLEDGRFAFALGDPLVSAGISAADLPTGVYLLTSLAETPERVNSMPPSSGIPGQVHVIWSRDGSGALLTQADRPAQPKIFYAPTDGDFLYEITAVFGRYPHDFQWQPEIMVP